MTGSLALLREGADVRVCHAEAHVPAVALLDDVERDVLQLVRRRSRILWIYPIWSYYTRVIWEIVPFT